MRSQGLKRAIVVVLMALAFCFGGVASAKNCTPFGCTPTQGNPIQELAGMVVAAGVVTVALYTVARGVVK